MGKPILALYGNDQGANNVLDSVQSAGTEDFEMVRIPGLNAEVTQESRAQIHASAAAVFGISTDMPEAKIAQEALQKNPDLSRKILFIEDFPGSNGSSNAVIQRIRGHIAVGTILPTDPHSQAANIYEQLHTIGYPDHWMPAMQHMQKAMDLRAQGGLMKRRRGQTDTEPIADNEIITYVSGFQDPVIEKSVLEFLLRLPDIDGKKHIVHFRAHPGENKKLYEQIAARDAMLDSQWEIANDEIVNVGRNTDPSLGGAADLTIAHPGTTATFWAGALRRKMITVMDFVTEAQRAGQSYNYELAGLHTHLIQNIGSIYWEMRKLLIPQSIESKTLLGKQQ